MYAAIPVVREIVGALKWDDFVHKIRAVFLQHNISVDQLPWQGNYLLAPIQDWLLSLDPVIGQELTIIWAQFRSVHRQQHINM